MNASFNFNIIPALITVVGLVLYLMTKDKSAEVGRWMFIIGLAATMYFGFRL